MTKNSEILTNAPVGAAFNVLEDDGTIFDVRDTIVRTESGYQFVGPNSFLSQEFPIAIAVPVFDGFPEDYLVPVKEAE